VLTLADYIEYSKQTATTTMLATPATRMFLQKAVAQGAKTAVRALGSQAATSSIWTPAAFSSMVSVGLTFEFIDDMMATMEDDNRHRIFCRFRCPVDVNWLH